MHFNAFHPKSPWHKLESCWSDLKTPAARRLTGLSGSMYLLLLYVAGVVSEQGEFANCHGFKPDRKSVV